MPLPDVAHALESFQQALDSGHIDLQAGRLDSKIFMHVDKPNGELRLTYVRIERGTVTAMVQFIRCDPVEGEPCFNVGWAVPPNYRGQGRAGDAFIAAVRELRHGLSSNGLKAFWVEGIVGMENTASQRLAERVISAPISTDIDSTAGVPIVQYLRRIDEETPL